MLIDDRAPAPRAPRPATEQALPGKPLLELVAPLMAATADAITAPVDPVLLAAAHGWPAASSPSIGVATRQFKALTWDALPDAVLVADGVGVLVAVNDAAERMLGIDAAGVIGTKLGDALPLIDDGGRLWWERTAPFSALSIVTRQPERFLLTTDGRPVLVTASFHRADGPGTTLTHLIVALRPATERTRVERRGAELVATAAHELRSPLTSIKGFTAQLLAKWDRFPDEQRRLIVETVDHDADRLSRLISELLDVARIDSHDVTLRCDWVDLQHTIKHCIATLVAGGADEARIKVDVCAGLPRVWADPDKIARVFINLLENAFRHGAGVVTTKVELVENDGPLTVSVSVTDEGQGIPEHLAARAFHKYWHASNDGTGLGLYVVRGLVVAHGGTISVARSADGGARFRFLLPVGAPPADGPEEVDPE